jgi:heat shock protein HslJ
VALGLLSCTPASEEPPDDVRPIDLAGTEWELSSLNGRPPLAGTRISLEFRAGSGGGYSGCNWYGGAFRSTDSSLSFGSLESTAQGCTLPTGVMEQEAEYHLTLSDVRSYHSRNRALEMFDAAGRVTLVFEPRETLAMNPEDLVGTRWRLHSVGPTMEPADTGVTLSLERGVASGFAGCRDYTARYTAQADRIAFTSISMTSTECRLGNDELLREGQYTTDLSGSTYYRVGADRLELTTAGGRKLIFSRD